MISNNIHSKKKKILTHIKMVSIEWQSINSIKYSQNAKTSIERPHQYYMVMKIPEKIVLLPIWWGTVHHSLKLLF